jgi:hypothetical protein
MALMELTSLALRAPFQESERIFAWEFIKGEPMRKAYIYAQANSIRDGYTSKKHQSDEVLIRANVGSGFQMHYCAGTSRPGD